VVFGGASGKKKSGKEWRRSLKKRSMHLLQSCRRVGG
jgi:hypothetical protein